MKKRILLSTIGALFLFCVSVANAGPYRNPTGVAALNGDESITLVTIPANRAVIIRSFIQSATSGGAETTPCSLAFHNTFPLGGGITLLKASNASDASPTLERNFVIAGPGCAGGNKRRFRVLHYL